MEAASAAGANPAPGLWCPEDEGGVDSEEGGGRDTLEEDAASKVAAVAWVPF